MAPDEGVTGRPPPRLGRRRLLHRSRRRHGPEGRPAARAPPLAGEVGGGGRRRVPDAEPGGAIHQRNEAAAPSRELWGHILQLPCNPTKKKFQKILKTILNVHLNLLHLYIKFQGQIRHPLEVTKKTNFLTKVIVQMQPKFVFL